MAFEFLRWSRPKLGEGALRRALGAGVVLWGLSFVLAWHGAWRGWLGFGSTGGMVRYGAAWGLVMAGILAGLPSRATGRRALSAALAALGTAGLIQYFGGWSGSPEFLFQPVVARELTGHAYLSPVTAFAFLLLGSSMLVFESATARARAIPLGIAGFGVLLMGLVSCMARLFGGGLSEWGFPDGLAMALPVALAMALLGLTHLLEAVGEGLGPTASRWIPRFFTLVGLILTALVFQATRVQRSRDLERVLRMEAASLEQHVRTQLGDRMNGMARMARRWTLVPPSRTAWADDAGQYAEHDFGFVFMEWVGPDRVVRWAEPRNLFGRWEGTRVADLEPDKRRPYDLADREGRTQLSKPFTLDSLPEPGLLMVAPIGRKDASGGYLIAIVRIQAWLGRVLAPVPAGRLRVTLEAAGRTVYQSGEAGRSDLAREREFICGGQPWRIRVAPGPALLKEIPNRVGLVVLAGGFALSLIAAMLAATATRARDMAEELTASVERFTGLIAHLHVGILLVGEDGVIELANRAFTSMFDVACSPADLKGLTSEQLVGLVRRPYEDPGMEEVRIRARLAEHRPVLDEEARVVGDRVVVRDYIPIVVKGQRRGRLWAFRDVTERKRVERLKDEFVATVSHELRTPLTAIRGSLGLLDGGVAGEISDQARDLIEISQRNTERLLVLINDLLDVQKIESGRMTFDFRVQDVASLAREAAEAVRPLAQRAGVALGLDLSEASCLAPADAGRLQQVLVNLLSNALKFSRSGGEVTLRLVPEEALVRLEVLDRGPGVPAAFVPRLFEKFSQAEGGDRRAQGGTGLGLSISKAILAGHGGEIGYRDREGGGACFYVLLPRV